MKKTLFILSFILLSVVSFAQRQRTTAVFDSDTTTRPKAGFYGIGVRANNIYFVPPTGNNIRLANYSLFTGLTTNYLSKWNGSKLANTSIFDNAVNIGIGTDSPSGVYGKTVHINGSSASIRMQSSSIILDITAASPLGYAYIGPANAYPMVIQTNSTDRLYISSTGNVGIATVSPTSKLQVVGLPTYADNTSAISGGLTSGAFYRTSIGVLMVVY